MMKWWNNCEFRQDYVSVSNLNIERHTIMANTIKVSFFLFFFASYLPQCLWLLFTLYCGQYTE